MERRNSLLLKSPLTEQSELQQQTQLREIERYEIKRTRSCTCPTRHRHHQGVPVRMSSRHGGFRGSCHGSSSRRMTIRTGRGERICRGRRSGGRSRGVRMMMIYNSPSFGILTRPFRRSRRRRIKQRPQRTTTTTVVGGCSLSSVTATV